MKLSRLLIAAVVLVALSGALWYSNKKEDEKANKPPEDKTVKILALNEPSIVGIEIKKRGGEDTVLSKSDSNVWSITAPKPLPADQSAVASITSATISLPSDRVIDDNATDLGSYGLAPAADELIFKMKDGKSKTLLVGDATPTGSDVYAKVADDTHLYTMASSSKTTFDKESKDLRDKRLLTFDQEKATRIELNAKKEALEFGRINQTDWQILKPKPLRADGFAVEELVRKLKEANMDTTLSADDAKKAAATWATATPVATVKVTDPGGTQTIEFRKVKTKDAEDYYAKSSVVDGVYKVSKDLGTGVDKGLDDFRTKKVFDFGFSDPTKIDFKDGTRVASYQKSGDKWTSNGKTMDSTTVQALIDKLRDLSATKFVDTGFGVAQVEIAVVSNDGKRTERVYIAPAADGKFIAKREAETAMYELDRNAVAEMRGVAADVKDEASKPPAAKKKVVPLGLSTDLYQLTMAAGYFEAGKIEERATFELFIRRLPHNRNFILATGLAQAVEYLQNLRYTKEEIDYLRTLAQFAHTSPGFFDYLAGLRFTGDLFAVPEGTPLFPNEPFLTLRAPLVEAQIPETYLLATIGFQSMIATKAARVVKAALGRSVVEFGTRRAHSPEAGVFAGRASYIGGCGGTSNTEAGMRFGIPVFGTAAHSWVMSFPSETTAFEQLQKLLGESTVYLIDSYDTLEGARRAAALGRPLWGVRLDSGNLVTLAPAVRKILDDAGLPETKIMATGDLNEYKIHELVAARAPIDVFGVGTELSTSADAPTLGVIYKMVELDHSGERRYTAKLSEDKHTLPGSKQVFRYQSHDLLARSTECPSCPDGSSPAEALMRPVMLGGQLVEPLPTADQARQHAATCLSQLPPACHSLFERPDAWRVELSPELEALSEKVQKGIAR